MILNQLINGTRGLLGKNDVPIQKRNLMSEFSDWASVAPYLLQYYQLFAPSMGGLAESQARGYLGAMERMQPRMQRLQAQSDRAGLTSFLDTMQAAGPQYRAAQQAMAPEFFGGLTGLLNDVQADFNSGYEMTPGERRLLTQNLRSAQASRGMGYGGVDAASEALATTQAGQGLRQQRLANLTGVLQMLGATVPAIPLSTGNAFGDTGRFLTGMATPLDTFVNPYNAYNSQVQDFNVNAQNWSNAQKVQARNEAWGNIGRGVESIAMMGAGGGLGGLGGAAGGAAGGGGGGLSMLSGLFG